MLSDNLTLRLSASFYSIFPVFFSLVKMVKRYIVVDDDNDDSDDSDGDDD